MPKTLKLPLKKILTDTCDIYGNAVTPDNTGHSPGTAQMLLQPNQACRLLPLTIRAKEYKADKMASISRYTLYIMPIANFKFNEHHFVKVNGDMFNIIEVLPVVMLGAPHEITLERVKP